MKNTLNNSHDTFAKAHLTDIVVARDFLKAHLPKNIASRCNLETLRIEPTSYIDEKLRHLTTDILYSLEIDNQRGFIYCLVEHQSTVDEIMPFRFWCYIAAILRQYADNKANKGKKLPIVVPLLFYTGSKSPYPASLELTDCFTDPVLAKEVITKPAKLIDLTVIRDEDIKGHGHVAMLELVMKHIRDRDILNLVYEILKLDKMYPNHNRKLPKVVLDYLVANGESESIDQFLTLIQQSENYRSDAMTIAEQLELRGEKRGMQQGMQQGIHEGVLLAAKNMLAEGADINFVKKVTGLSAEELAKINTKH